MTYRLSNKLHSYFMFLNYPQHYFIFSLLTSVLLHAIIISSLTIAKYFPNSTSTPILNVSLEPIPSSPENLFPGKQVHSNRLIKSKNISVPEKTVVPSSLISATSTPPVQTSTANDLQLSSADETTSIEPAQTESVAIESPAALNQAGEKIEPDWLNHYQRAIIALAQKYKRYPRVALEREWEGKVEVALTMNPNGEIQSLNVQHSSHYAPLDAEALAIIRKAAIKTEVPAALREKEFTVTIPVVFNLKK